MKFLCENKTALTIKKNRLENDMVWPFKIIWCFLCCCYRFGRIINLIFYECEYHTPPLFLGIINKKKKKERRLKRIFTHACSPRFIHKMLYAAAGAECQAVKSNKICESYRTYMNNHII